MTATPFVALNLRTGMACNAHPTRSWANLPPCSPRSAMSADEFLDAK